MKKTTLFVPIIVLALCVVACTNQENSTIEQITVSPSTKEVRKEVWSQLPPDQKDMLVGTWAEGTVTIELLKDSMVAPHSSELNEFIGKEVYAIEFPIKSKSSLSNIVVFAEMKTNHYIGNGLVD